LLYLKSLQKEKNIKNRGKPIKKRQKCRIGILDFANLFSIRHQRQLNSFFGQFFCTIISRVLPKAYEDSNLSEFAPQYLVNYANSFFLQVAVEIDNNSFLFLWLVA
jgi:hypothetical protein